MTKQKVKNKKIISQFKISFSSKESLFKFLDLFPFPIQIFADDGTLVFANESLCQEFNIASVNELIGVYNLLNDPIYFDNEMGFIQKSFQGESSFISIKVPLEDIYDRFAKKIDKDAETKHMDVTSFSIWCEQFESNYPVLIYIPRNTYKGTKEIRKAQEYIIENWLEEFHLEQIAAAAGLSIRNFSRLFNC